MINKTIGQYTDFTGKNYMKILDTPSKEYGRQRWEDWQFRNNEYQYGQVNPYSQYSY